MLKKILLVLSIFVVYVTAKGPIINLDPELTSAIESAAVRVIEHEINRESYERVNNLVGSSQYDEFHGITAKIKGLGFGRGIDRESREPGIFEYA